MSNRAQEWAKAQHVGNHGAKFILWVLADYAGPDGGSCFPTIKSLCDDTEMGERTISRHLDYLEEKNLIARYRLRRPDGTLGRYNYRLNMAVKLLTAEPDQPPAKLTSGQIDQWPKTTEPPANLAALKPSLEPSINKKTTLTREDFLREIDQARIDGRFLTQTDNESLIAIEAGSAWDYWLAYPDKKPSGDMIAAFVGWLRQSRAVKAAEKLVSRAAARQEGEAAPTAQPTQPWHERIARKIGEAPARAWIYPLHHDGQQIVCPSALHRERVLRDYRPQIEAEFRRGIPIIVGQITQEQA